MWFSRFICTIFGHRILPVFMDITVMKPQCRPYRLKMYWCERCEKEITARDDGTDS